MRINVGDLIADQKPFERLGFGTFETSQPLMGTH